MQVTEDYAKWAELEALNSALDIGERSPTSYPQFWRWQNPEFCDGEWREIVDFRLIYEGQLLSRSSRHLLENKNHIRMVMHEQLFQLWSSHSRLQRLMRRWGPIYHMKATQDRNLLKTGRPIPEDGETEADAIGRRYERGGIRFVPLVNEVFELVCSLNILFLRREKPGAIITQGGDIDNRIKTVIDALRVPKNADEMRDYPNTVSPLFCLMADDSLVTDLNIVTDRLLTPPAANSGHPESDAHLVIHVKVKASVENVEGLKEIM